MDKDFLIRLISIYMAITEPIKFDHKADIETYETIFNAHLASMPRKSRSIHGEEYLIT